MIDDGYIECWRADIARRWPDIADAIANIDDEALACSACEAEIEPEPRRAGDRKCRTCGAVISVWRLPSEFSFPRLVTFPQDLVADYAQAAFVASCMNLLAMAYETRGDVLEAANAKVRLASFATPEEFAVEALNVVAGTLQANGEDFRVVKKGNERSDEELIEMLMAGDVEPKPYSGPDLIVLVVEAVSKIFAAPMPQTRLSPTDWREARERVATKLHSIGAPRLPPLPR